jgi:FixJ family two-component response regulator
LVLVDVVLPRLSGPELAERLSAIRPGIAVLFMSGYMDEVVTRHGMSKQKLRLIRKPFTPADLVQTVRDTLEATH